jgi:hypothetical protein
MASAQLEDAPAVVAISFGNEEGIRFGFSRLRHTLPFDRNKKNYAGWFAHCVMSYGAVSTMAAESVAAAGVRSLKHS